MLASDYNNGCTPELCVEPFNTEIFAAKLYIVSLIIGQMVKSNYQTTPRHDAKTITTIT